MYTSSDDSDSDSGTNFKRGKRKPKDESPVKPVNTQRHREEPPKSRRDDRSERFESRPEPRNDARTQRTETFERQPRRSAIQHEKNSRQSNETQSRSHEINHKSIDSIHIRPKPARSISRDRHEAVKHSSSSSDRRSDPKRSRSAEKHSRNRQLSPERRKSPRKDVLKDLKKDSRDRERIPDQPRTQNNQILAKEQSKHVKKPSPDAKHVKDHHSKPDSSHHRGRSLQKETHKDIRSDQSTSQAPSHTSKPSRGLSQDESASYGPVLPPPMTKKVELDDYAPAMPRNLKRRSSSPKQHHKSKNAMSKSPDRRDRNFGPSLPKDFQLPMETDDFVDDDCDLISSDDDACMIGPLPTSSEMSERDLELEKRKIEIKLQQLDRRMQAVNSSDAKHREEWMLELPEIRKVPDMGLSARQFRKNDRPDFSDRSSWTKTPNDQHKKSSHGEKPKASDEDKRRDLEMRRRDEEQEKMAKDHKKAHKREKTLMEIHEKKLKKEKKKQKDEKQVRVPFSRDTDLAVNKFDEARKKSALKKAQLLDSRFSSGGRKYL